jgi:hypothetical protein
MVHKISKYQQSQKEQRRITAPHRLKTLTRSPHDQHLTGVRVKDEESFAVIQANVGIQNPNQNNHRAELSISLHIVLPDKKQHTKE